MKILFIYVDAEEDKRLDFYPGLSILSSMLKSRGHRAELTRTSVVTSEMNLFSILSDKRPNLIAFSIMTNSFPRSIYYARLIKGEMPDIPIICGGYHPSLVPEEVIQHDCFDFLCIGEGEYALLDLCEALEKGKDYIKIKNLWCRKEGKIYRNDIRPLITDLDTLPFADRNLFSYEGTWDFVLKRSTFMASRGCPYLCTYCCDMPREIYKRGYVRFRSVDNLLEEIKQVVKVHSSQSVSFHDDILTLDRNWFEEFAKRYKKEINLPFRCNTRVNLLDREMILLLKEAGCHRLNVGLESGNEFIRNEVLKRKISKEQYIKVFDLCKSADIETHTYNMIGIPFEDMTKILDTIKFNAMLRPKSMQLSYFYPFPKTPLYELSKKEGFLGNDAVDSYFKDTILRLPTVTKEDLHFVFKKFHKLVFLFEPVYKLPSCVSRMYDLLLTRLYYNHHGLINFLYHALFCLRTLRLLLPKSLCKRTNL